MSTNNRVFELHASRIAMVMQLCFFVLIMGVLYHLFTAPLWCISFVLMLGGWFYFLRQPQIQRFEHLDGVDWSFDLGGPVQSIQTRQIHQMIDHHAYIVIYFSSTAHKNIVIWRDQLSLSQWKKLKLMVKLA